MTTDVTLSGSEVTVAELRTAAFVVIRDAFDAVPFSKDVFEILVHQPSVLDAIRMLIADNVPASAIVSRIARARFTEITLYRLLGRATIIDLITPLHELR